MPKTTIRLSIENQFGRYEMAETVDDSVCSEQGFFDLKPPDPFISNMETAIAGIRKRVLRKDILIVEATRLGQMLAERLEDKEGWHGEDRRERLEKK